MSIEIYLNEKAKIIDKTIEKYVPRAFSKESAVFEVNPPRYAHNLSALNKAVADPIWNFLERGGKRWRPALFLLVVEALGKNADELMDFAAIPEVVHNGTIMIDDIEDSSEQRRGKPCSHRIFGEDIAINAGNAMYYLPLLALLVDRKKLGVQKLLGMYEIYSQEMINLSLGQAMDIAWHRGLARADTITEKDYLQMCAYKTGTLARMAARMGAVLADADQKTVDRLGFFAESLGIAFQMKDDVLDLSSDDFGKKKGGKGQDITEGKRSLIVIHTLQVAGRKDRARLIEILNMHTSAEKLRNEAIGIMTKCGSIDYVRSFSQKLVRDSWDQMDQVLPPSRGKKRLKAFAEFLIERKI